MKNMEKVLKRQMKLVFQLAQEWPTLGSFWASLDKVIQEEQHEQAQSIAESNFQYQPYQFAESVVEYDLPPLRIEDFQLGATLGSGTNGDVRVARHKASHFLVALKKIPKSAFKGNDKLKEHIKSEYKVGTFVNHPKLVKIFGAFCDNEYFYFIMQLMKSSLRNEMKKRNFKLYKQEEAAKIVQDVCQGLGQLHFHGVMHRDLKPQNILLSYGGDYKLGDFGLTAKSYTRQTFCGTPIYMAPEIKAKLHYTNAVDIWALGIIVYQLLCCGGPIQKMKDQLRLFLFDFNESGELCKQDTGIKYFLAGTLAREPLDRFHIFKLLRSKFITQNKQRNAQIFIHESLKSLLN